MSGKDDKSSDPTPPAADPAKDDKSPAPAGGAANPPASDPEAERTRAELEELRKFKAQQEADARAAETKRLEEAGEFEKVKAQLQSERAQVEANFRAELAARDIRSAALEHLAEAHRDKLDLVVPAVQAAAGELKWDGLTLKTDVAKAARETIAKLGFGVAAADDKGGAKGADKGRRQGAPPPPAPKPERHDSGGGNPPPKPAHVPMRALVLEAVQDVLGDKS